MATPPPKCPVCDSDQLEMVAGALLNGLNKQGRLTPGWLGFGTCKNCGAHFEQFRTLDRDTIEARYQCKVLPDDEWQRELQFWSGNRKLEPDSSK